MSRTGSCVNYGQAAMYWQCQAAKLPVNSSVQMCQVLAVHSTQSTHIYVCKQRSITVPSAGKQLYACNCVKFGQVCANRQN